MSPNQKPKHFVIYTRVSTDDQARGDYTSLDVQAHHCGNHLEALDYEAIQTVKDDGYSGKNLKRPGIQSVLKEIGVPNKEKKFDGIIFYKLDRLSRSPKDIYRLIDLFRDNNIDFISVKESLDSGTAIGRALIGILAVISALEREITGERVRDSGIARVRQGKWIGGYLPYGYKLVNDGAPHSDGKQPHKIVINEEVGPKIKFIWQLAADNKSLRFIARELEKRAIKSPTGKSWRNQSVLGILRNSFYTGKVKWAGEIHKGNHPTLVDPKLWDRANKMIGAKLPGHRFVTKPKTYIYLLESLLKCGECGSYYITKYARGGSGPQFYYYICGRKNQGLGCDLPRISATAFDQAVIDYFRKASKDQKIIIRAIEQAIADAKNKLTTVDKDIKKVEKRLESLQEEADKLLDLALKDTVSKGKTYKSRMEKLEEEITLLEDSLSKLHARKRTAEMSANSGQFIHSNLTFAMAKLDQIPPEAQKSLFRSLIKEIIVYKDHLDIKMFIGQPIEKAFLPEISHNNPGNNNSKRNYPIAGREVNLASASGSQTLLTLCD